MIDHFRSVPDLLIAPIRNCGVSQKAFVPTTRSMKRGLQIRTVATWTSEFCFDSVESVLERLYCEILFGFHESLIKIIKRFLCYLNFDCSNSNPLSGCAHFQTLQHFKILDGNKCYSTLIKIIVG